MRAILFGIGILLTGCEDIKVSEPEDLDGDGYLTSDEDCDDGDPAIHPDAPEVCDQKDNNCNSEFDEGLMNDWYPDVDGDGHGGKDGGLSTCNPPDGYTTLSDDCNDDDATIFPGAQELCDSVDNNCDGVVDDEQLWYPDNDQDGFGDQQSAPVKGCKDPSSWSLNGEDCNDQNAAINPGESEVCDGVVDEDCDDLVDAADPSLLDGTDWYLDADQDGYGDDGNVVYACEKPEGESRATIGGDCKDSNAEYHPGALENCDDTRDLNCDGFTGTSDHDGDGVPACEDCDDGSATVYPGAVERCDGVDNDCVNGVDIGAEDASSWYRDSDEDGYGDVATVMDACDAPWGYVKDSADCDDADENSFPGNPELCDHRDNDCNGQVDDADQALMKPMYTDADGDGYGSSPTGSYACFSGNGLADNGDDCDDGDPQKSPANTWYPDLDGDGYGDMQAEVQSCVQPANWIPTGGDCNDADPLENLAPTWYLDADGDGLGNAMSSQESCVQPAGYVDNADDCNDASASTLGASIWYLDYDADNHGDPGKTLASCLQPSSYVSVFDDCDDQNASSYPGAKEVCDGSDNDCDGTADINAVDPTTFYLDSDGDGHGDASLTTASCTLPSGYASLADDCDDLVSSTYPGAPEFCDQVDNDCDGNTDNNPVDPSSFWPDNDGDGYGSGASISSCTAPSGYAAFNSDCDDSDPSIYPSADEYCDGIDNNCDASTDGSDSVDATSYYKDLDQDGYGDPSTEVRSCSNPGGGRIADNQDCNDGNTSVKPGGAENWYDGVDGDCDGNDNPSVCDSTPDDTTIAYDATCINTNTTVAWSISEGWPNGSITWSTNPTYTHVASSPIVVQLNDDDGDGLISERDTPDFAFVTSVQTTNGKAGCLRMVDGFSRAELSSFCADSSFTVNATSSLAAADMDEDGTPEVLVVATGGNLLAINPNGSRKWASSITTAISTGSMSAPISIANLDSDAAAEVLAGDLVVDNDGKALRRLSADCAYGIPADLDQDGDAEIVCGGGVYDYLSNAFLWRDSSGTGGFPAVADLDWDGNPEVIQSKAGKVTVYDGITGSVQASYSSPYATSGAPVVANFLGSTNLDIGVPLTSEYDVLQYQNNGSSKKLVAYWGTGVGLGQLSYASTASDLDGDGKSEIIYADKSTFHIWSAYKNLTLYTAVNYAGTGELWAGPVVADYDGDGNAEVLVPGAGSSWDGLKVLEEDDDNWGNAPLIWNQYWYTGSNINEDMTVSASAWWLEENVFHASTSPSGNEQGAADLTLDLLGKCADCAGQNLTVFYLSLENIGSERAGGYTNFAAYTVDSSGALIYLEGGSFYGAILPGDHLAPVAITIDNALILNDSLVFAVDDDGAGNGMFEECDESNNTVSWNEAVCP